MRFASHRDIARALERALRRARVPVAFSAGFTPHPKISYTGAAPTGVASEAEYFELTLTEPCDPEQVRVRLDDAMPAGIDVVGVVEAAAGGLADRLEASEWQVELPGVAPDDAAAAAAAFLAAGEIEVERLTKKGRRRFDTRSPVLRLDVDGCAATEQHETYAILRMVVRHTTPAVRPDDVVTGLRQVAGLAPPSSPLMTRLAQGPLDEASGVLADPFAADIAAAQSAGRGRAEDGGGAEGIAPLAEDAPRSSAPTRKRVT
ncbi:radical SAM-linked protein [Spinactinospora alkalitolerans]|uniref:Radical SAM-linked protein n=1 Tax=Spinactinospora alkalitolerans TaxID=687207 RepID=A0A852TWB3_9ACTN|nr:TIGR03936 family radical SAM-associated protein [Spinactinospora alkalitolerans]NYE46364.1 radical SAM-linked protein [Spinactinospora alkalitolerans]